MKNTRRSLLMSSISLLLCFVMLMGTTFAWFTDVASSIGNIIQTGRLDAEMYWSDSLLSADSTEWKNAEGAKVFEYNNWEPGYTEVIYIKVANAGNLSFKWKLTVEANGTVTDLADVIKVYYVNPVTNEITKDELQGRTSAGTLTDVLEISRGVSGESLTPGGSQILAIAFHMDEAAGNDYQDKSLCDEGFSLRLVATQATVENDSFGNDYDTDSEWPNIPSVGNSASTSVTLDASNKLTEEVTMTSADGKISATLPVGTELRPGTTEIKLVVSDKENSDANLSLDENEASLSLDVHVTGVAAGNTEPIKVYLGEVLPKGLNIGNYALYHVEDAGTVTMTHINNSSEIDHNTFEYNPATGEVTVYLASFSEVALVAAPAVWKGKADHTWYDANATELTIANADQLWSFSQIVGGMAKDENGNFIITYEDSDGDEHHNDTFLGKTIKLLANVNLGDKNDASSNIFYPIGYYNDAGHYNKPTDGTATAANVTSFQGTFDGNGHTIANFYQNTWQMWGNYDGNYYKAAMGLFGYVYGGTIKNLTVDNFSSDGEFTPTGVIAAYAVNSNFENIAITNCNPRVYNTGNGGIIGIAGRVDATVKEDIILRNITVDNTNKISALWGSYDVACGGLVGMFRGNEDASGDTITFANCHVSAQIDVYNDVCGNYQYYAYRYSGMIIGSVRHNTTNDEGRTIPNMAGIYATDCTVNYGDWNDYYYCEFEKNGHPSYSGPDDYKFSRIPHSEINFTDTNGNGVIDADERASVTGCKHNHTEAENVQCVFLPFYQLFTGYSWGVSSIGLKEYSGIVTNLGITEGDNQASVEKFEGNVNTLVDYTEYKLGDIFAYLDNCKVPVVHSALNVSITNLDDSNPVSMAIDYDDTNWENGTITLNGVGTITITIQDYYFCTPTTITVSIEGHAHVYENDCDATCNVCQETRTVNHTYDNGCDVDCNVCGEERTELTHTPGETVKENNNNATCTEAGSYDNVVYCSECGKELSRETVIVDAIGHSYNKVVTAPTCTAEGYTTYTCAVCGDSYVADQVAALGHSYDLETTAPTCTADGYTTYTCECGDTYVSDEVPALGHSYNAVTTAPTCTTDGYTTYTCSVCTHSYTGNETASVGHNEVIDAAVAPTCTVSGKTEGKHCPACNEVLIAQETVAALGHTEVTDAAVAPTCTVSGKTEGKHCSVCGEVLVAQTVVAAKGHTVVVDAAVAATCTETGLTEGKHCSKCDYKVAQEVVPATGHKHSATVTAPTCTTAGYTTYTCACGDTYTDNETEALGHITTNFTGDFLYRVGNQNAVNLSSLFSVGKHNVTVSGTTVAGSATVTVNGTSLTFSGTGVVKVTLSSGCTCNECDLELNLEVVEAINATSATDAKDKDVVLLNNIGSGFTVDNGHTVYGNGFTLTYTGDGRYLNNGLKQGVVMVQNGGTLDNLHIKAPIYPTAFMYYGTTQLGDYVQQSTNPREVDGDKTRYYYQLSAVATYGDATISNCYIYGGRTNIYVNTGNVTVKDSVLECGVVANVQMQSTNEYTVTLENLTTIQYRVNATIGDTSKVMLGAGVLVGPETTSNPTIVLNGNLKQYNWVTADDKAAVSGTMAQMIIQGALDAAAYNHTINGKTASNLGIIFMNDKETNIKNNTGLPYKDGTVTMSLDGGSSINGKVYSVQNANANQIYSDYVNADRSTVNGDYVPRFDFNLGNQEISYDGSEDTRYLYGDKNGVTALYQDGNDALTLDLTKLATIYKYDGISYTITVVCKDSNGNVLTATNGVVTLSAQGSYTLVFTAQDNLFYNKNGETISKSVERTYTVPLTLTVKEANVKNAVVNITKTALDGVYTTVNLTDYKLRINFLDAISITDYDNKGNGTTVSLSNNIGSVSLTPASVNVFTTAFTVTVTYTDGRVLTVNFSKISGSSPGTKTAVVNTSGGLYFITEGALDNKPTASSSQNKCTITSVSFKGNSGSTVTNDTDVTVTWALGSSSGCFAEGTLITLADGTQKPIEEITFEDQLLVWDFNTGAYAVTVPSLIDRYDLSRQNVINLKFSDGTVVRMVIDHGFFDVEANKFVFLNEENVASYVGHTFVKVADNGAYENVELVGYEITVEDVAYYSIQTAFYNNCIAEGMFTLTAPPEMLGYNGWFDYFEIGEGMKYDEEKMQADIEKYGLYTYEDFADYVTYEQFIAFNGPYLKVLVGRGVVTYDQIIELIGMYVNPEN